MEAINGVAWQTVAAADFSGSARAEKAGREKEAQDGPVKPVKDEYIPEEGGRKEKDRDGTRGIKDDGSGRTEKCTGNTDKVDREIERLKKEKAKLEQELGAETDGARAEWLERRLAQVDRELQQKDNDGYRRQHTVFS